MEPLDDYYGWNILNDAEFEKTKQLVKEADHVHIAFPCRSFTRARRTDEFGFVQELRSEEKPEGWGLPLAEEGNRHLERTAALCLHAEENETTVSVENPWDSYAWDCRVMKKVMGRYGYVSVQLNQCAYGAKSVKPTRIVTNSLWIQEVNRLCGDVAKHTHIALKGKVYDPVEDKYVWRTSKAAEYPQGLCEAWARSLAAFLESPAGEQYMLDRTFVKMGRYQNVLVRASKVRRTDVPPKLERAQTEEGLTPAQQREKENAECYGGLRDPQTAVVRNQLLRIVGERVRSCMDRFISSTVAARFEAKPSACPFSDEELQEARTALAKEFDTEACHDGYEKSLFSAVLEAANDPDAKVIPSWIETGFPLGVKSTIEHTGVFPKTDQVSASIQASQAVGHIMDDWEGNSKNYASFGEAGPLAEEELERLVQLGRADKVGSWQQVVDLVGNDACITPLACIVKVKDGKTKTRLIVDMRRSGINGQVALFERIVLPRVSDVAKASKALRNHLSHQDDVEFCSADFSDAFYTLHLRQDERACVIVKNAKSEYYCFRVVGFGIASAPLLWSRLCAATMRVSQAATNQWEGRAAVYVDDPVLIVGGCDTRARSLVILRYLLIWMVFGFKISWNKVQRGQEVTWIGVRMVLEHATVLRVTLTPDKTAKLRMLLQELVSRPVVSVQKLQLACCVLGWLSSIIPICRPWMCMLYGTLTQAKNYVPAKETTRIRKGLCFRKQLEHAVHWLQCLLESKSQDATLRHRYSLVEDTALTYHIECDACPQGMGGVLYLHHRPIMFWQCPLSDKVLELLGPNVKREPTFQTEFEFLALFISVKKFAEQVRNEFRFFIRADNISALHSALRYKSKSPLLTRLVAELALEQEINNRPPLDGRHLYGLLNDVADKLSRGEVANKLQGVPQLELTLDRTLFRAWPEPE